MEFTVMHVPDVLIGGAVRRDVDRALRAAPLPPRDVIQEPVVCARRDTIHGCGAWETCERNVREEMREETRERTREEMREMRDM
jgi:hypothetical protein